jgi:Xaa-Pro aminopeptidase
MTHERAKRAGEAIRKAGADWGILTGFENVCYAAGHVASIEDGFSSFAGGPGTAIVSKAGDVVGLVVSNVEGEGAAAAQATHVEQYVGYDAEEQTDQESNYLKAVLAMARKLGVGGTIAVEPSTFPAAVRAALEPTVERFVSVTTELARIRAVKTPGEIEMLRHCARLATIGQKAALARVRAGLPEFKAWAEIRAAMELAENKRLSVVADFRTGIVRTVSFTGPPNDRIVRDGDPVIIDLGPRAANGYWGDSCNTFVLGEPSVKFVALHGAVVDALAECARVLRPGIRANELDEKVRAVVRKSGFEHPHHTGHGIGAGVHEWPRIVARETAVLEPDMVLMIEPGAYAPGIGGVRCEWMFRITGTGNELLSTHAHTLTPGAWD